jgi:MHS family proline/betaine transporter-like MFS transporter
MSEAAIGRPGAAGAADLDGHTRRRAIISSAVGNFVELYDFLIYGLFAAQIAANFFPKGDPTAALLQAFAIYGVGFFMRPIGAIVIGAYGDKKGRKNALVFTVGLMATATAVTGLIPSYGSIGVGAPLLLLLCRLVQGFSTGGEWAARRPFSWNSRHRESADWSAACSNSASASP